LGRNFIFETGFEILIFFSYLRFSPFVVIEQFTCAKPLLSGFNSASTCIFPRKLI